MLYGIQASQDVKLSNVARSLNESIALIKTEDRLSHEVPEQDLTDLINARLSWQGAGWVNPDTVLALDLGDVQKPYGRKMEYLLAIPQFFRCVMMGPPRQVRLGRRGRHA
jgi:hypothetical protein